MGAPAVFLAASRAALTAIKSAQAAKLMRWSMTGASALMLKPVQDHVQSKVQTALENRFRPTINPKESLLAAPVAIEPVQQPSSLRLDPPMSFTHIPTARPCVGLIAVSDLAQNRLSFVTRFEDGVVTLCPADSLRASATASDRDI